MFLASPLHGASREGEDARQLEISRCDRKKAEVILEFADGLRPAYMATMDILEWDVEKRLILKEGE